jgi:hypothetical protein
MNETAQNDHAFCVEADIVKLNDVKNRLLVEGYLGAITEISYVEGLLVIKGLEGNLKINLKEKEIEKIINEKSG